MTRLRFLQIVGEWSRGDGPLYARLAGAIRAAIERGDLPAGDAPSRAARAGALARGEPHHDRHGLRSARRRAVARSRQGSGTSSGARRRGRPPRAGAAAVLSARNAVFRGLVEAHRRRDRVPRRPLRRPPQDLRVGVEGRARRRRPADARPRLHAAQGYLNCAAAIAAHLERFGLPTRPEQVLVTSGAQQAIGLAANLLVEAATRSCSRIRPTRARSTRSRCSARG